MKFSHPLPRIECEGRNNGTYNNPEVEYPGFLNTVSPRMGLFMEALRDTVRGERRLLMIDGQVLLCNHNWIRDCYYMFEVFKHWEYDNHSFYDFLLNRQTEKGYFYELIKQMDDYHWKMVNEDCRVLFPEDHLSMVRLELEADVEYIMVQYASVLYQVDGDLAYIEGILPRLEKAIDYMTSDEKRWNPELGLVVRPYTIDTWDFTTEIESGLDRRIYMDRLCAMHGDNSGVFAAMRTLSRFNRLLGRGEKAKEWDERAEKLKESMMRHLWNGKFFIHQKPVTCAPLDGHENERLSLSNVYDINRGVTSLAESRSIIEEYMRRRETTDAFAEFFTIDPPYPMFKEFPAGKYVNGAISPFTAGELALAAFENGYEEYGYDILCRFLNLWEKDGGIYFLYARQGGPVSVGSGPSGWGAASLLKAVEQGLSGVRDLGAKFSEMRFSPRWTATEYDELRYVTGYEKTHVHVDIRYEYAGEAMNYLIVCPSVRIEAHILLPKGKKARSVTANGKELPFENAFVADSPYADFTVTKDAKEKAEIVVTLEDA